MVVWINIVQFILYGAFFLAVVAKLARVLCRYLICRWKALIYAWTAHAKQGTNFRAAYAEECRLLSKGMGPLELRAVADQASTRQGAHPHFIEIRGQFPVSSNRHGLFVTSIFDISEPSIRAEDLKHLPVGCSLDAYREPQAFAYQARCNAGEIKPRFGYPRWVSIATMIPETLQPPRSGRRRLRIVVRLIDSDKPPLIRNGSCERAHFIPERVIWQGTHDFDWDFYEPGWLDRFESDRAAFRDALSTGLRIGVAVATISHDMSDSDGAVIRDWIRQMVANMHPVPRKEMQDLLNETLRATSQERSAGTLQPVELAGKLRALNNRGASVNCMELVYGAVGANRVIDRDQLALARKIGTTLGIDAAELERLADRALIKADFQVDPADDIGGMLGIDPAAGPEEIRHSLRKEFQKWNNRLATLKTGEERDHAQQRLDLIAQARETYVFDTTAD